MKAIFFLLTFTLFSSAALSQDLLVSDILVRRSTSVADSTNKVAEHFNELAQMWMRAYNNNDSTTLASLYTPDADYISSHVPGLVAHERDRVIANFQRGIKSGGHIDSISILSIQLSCDLATLLCQYEATNSGQKAIGRNLLVVKKVNEKWLIILHMTVV
jgi:ketosteroid isomerase-like protein